MYIDRTLTLAKGTRDERHLTENEVASLCGPIVLLGEPGLGKTELTRSLTLKLGALRVTAGQFNRTQVLERLMPPQGKRLIIDGLDEITATVGSSVDAVLSKLSTLAYPPFIVSCRSADWEGAVGRYKIEEDLGVAPAILHLEPFTLDDARRFMTDRLEADRAHRLIGTVESQGLQTLTSNPLTLRLLCEIAAEGGDLPRTRGELFDNAVPLLTKEKNPAHSRRGAAKLPLETLLDGAGAIFAHLILAGLSGVSRGGRDEPVDGFVSDVEVLKLDGQGIEEVMHTRLLSDDGESLLVPVHRLIAEFLAGRWMAKRICDGLTKRRALQSLHSMGGVPAALRGVHAWLACFCPTVADDCIRADPYGLLRYGDANRLTLQQVRTLITALSSLSAEDPYFRSEDWGVRAVCGLARFELKDELLKLVTASDRPLQLSTLLLESMKDSELATAIAPDLQEMFCSEDKPYIERRHAMEVLAAGNLVADWTTEVRLLVGSQNSSSRRLALETIRQVSDQSIPGDLIAEALIGYHGLERDDHDRHAGVDHGLAEKLGIEQIVGALDRLGDRFAECQQSNKYWNPHHSLSTTTVIFLRRALEEESALAPDRIWRWVRCLDCKQTYSDRDRGAVGSWFVNNDKTRRTIQQLAFANPLMGETPWMAICNDLPKMNAGLALTTADAAYFLNEVASEARPSPSQIALWKDIVQYYAPRRGVPDELKPVISHSVEKHSVLAEEWALMLAPPVRDWEKEHAAEREKAERKRAAKHAQHRAKFRSVEGDIASGRGIVALNDLAKAYLGLYREFSSDSSPRERLVEWVGEALASSAERGFVALLSRDDLPSAKQIVEARVEGKRYNTQLPMLCGAGIMRRQGTKLCTLSKETLLALLVEWWDMADWHEQVLGSGIQEELEAAVLVTVADRVDIARTIIEPFLQARQEEIRGLWVLRHTKGFETLLGKLALEWLRNYDSASHKAQAELLEVALERAPIKEVANLIAERLPDLSNMSEEARRDWIAAGFVSDAEEFEVEASRLANADPKFLWSIRQYMGA